MASISAVISAYSEKGDTRSSVESSVGDFWSLCGLSTGAFCAEDAAIKTVPDSRAIGRISTRYTMNTATVNTRRIVVPVDSPSGVYDAENTEVRTFLSLT